MIPADSGILYANDFYEMVAMAIDLLSNPYQQDRLCSRGIYQMNLHCNWKTQLQLFEQMIANVERA